MSSLNPSPPPTLQCKQFQASFFLLYVWCSTISGSALHGSDHAQLTQLSTCARTSSTLLLYKSVGHWNDSYIFFCLSFFCGEWWADFPKQTTWTDKKLFPSHTHTRPKVFQRCENLLAQLGMTLNKIIRAVQVLGFVLCSWLSRKLSFWPLFETLPVREAS